MTDDLNDLIDTINGHHQDPRPWRQHQPEDKAEALARTVAAATADLVDAYLTEGHSIEDATRLAVLIVLAAAFQTERERERE